MVYIFPHKQTEFKFKFLQEVVDTTMYIENTL
jgi:hypothetical protein